MPRLLTIVLLILLSQMGFGQIAFTAFSDAKEVVSGQYFSVTFSLENARGVNFKAPSFKDFDVAAGPSTSSEMTFINGRSTQKISYSYTLSTSKEGNYTIGPASITVNGKVYQTEPVSVQVVKGRTRNSGATTSNEDFIVEAILDFDTAYVGQQLTLKYILYTTQDVQSINFRRLPDFDGFFAQELQAFNARTTQVVRDGVQYYRRVLKVIALFPQQKGVFEFSPADITLGVSDGRRSSSFFFNTRLRQYQTRSESVTATVVSTPSNAPISFSGAIGDFFMGTSVDKRTIASDDALTLTLQIRGIGDGKFIQAPQQPYTDLFDIYDPNLLEEKSEVVSDKIQVTKTYEYLMIPKKVGQIKFNPEMTYYDVDSSKYVTIYAQQYQVNVLPGDKRELTDVQDNQRSLIKPPPLKRVSKRQKSFSFSTAHWMLNGLLIAMLAGLFAKRNIRNRRENVDPAIRRAQKARRMAVEKLSVAKVSLDQNDVKSFYIQLRQGLQEYLSDKINLPSAQLSKDQIRDLLDEFQLNDLTPGLLEIMRKGEQAIYASIAPGHEIADYQHSLEIIEKIEILLNSN